MTKPRNNPSYTIYAEITDRMFDLTGYFSGHYGWIVASDIQTEGDNIVELYQNCYVGTVGKDGGEGPTLHYEDLPEGLKRIVRTIITNEYLKQLKTLVSEYLKQETEIEQENRKSREGRRGIDA